MTLRIKLLFAGLALVLAVLAGGAFLARELSTTSADTIGSGAMALRATGASCDDADNPTKCTVDPGATFTLNVALVERTANGTVGVQTYVEYPGLTYNIEELPANEIKFTPSALPVRAPGLTADSISHGTTTGIVPPFPASTYKGNIVNLSMTCPSSPGSHLVRLVAQGEDPAGGSGAAITPSDGTGGTAPDIPTGDTLTINCGAGAPADTPTPTVEGPPPTATSTTEPTATATHTVPAPPTATVTRTPTTAPATATRTPTTVPEKQLGDVNDDGEVNSTDALMILQLEARRRSTLPNLDSADVNGDGLVNSIDALFILWIEAEII
jgi:hypothetical protein